jgi:hypothetical protein
MYYYSVQRKELELPLVLLLHPLSREPTRLGKETNGSKIEVSTE